MEKETMQCRIFQDPEKNKLIDSNSGKNIITLGKYYPKTDNIEI
jgi:hypothetical protein